MNFTRSFLLRDLGVKVLILLLATFVWLIVSSNQERVGTFPGGVPIQLSNIPDNLIATTDDRQVDLTLVANNAIWQSMNADSFRAAVDLTNAKSGVAQRTISVTSALPGARIIGVKPQHTLVRLEPLEQKSVPVRIVYEGQAEDGYVPDEAITDPANVLLLGAKSELMLYDEVVGKVVLSGQRLSFQSLATLNIPNQNQTRSTLKVSPQEVLANVSLKRAGNIKTLGVIVKTEGSPPSGFVVSSLSVSPSTVVVTGNSASLSNLTALSTKPISLSEIREPSQVDTEFVLPDGVRLVDPSSPIASVAISVKASLSPSE